LFKERLADFEADVRHLSRKLKVLSGGDVAYGILFEEEEHVEHDLLDQVAVLVEEGYLHDLAEKL